MRCPACDAENPETARYCAGCGGRLTASCPHCQAPVGAGDRYCMACGGPTSALRPDSAASEPEPAGTGPAERRRISVLFVDLENFTALAESLDPEEVRTVQSRYFEVARSIVARYGGTIEKFIGDAVMAVWGAPLAHEDDADRAVRAAIEIVGAVGRLGGAASGRALSARAAVTTGEAAVTVGAPGQGMVAGDLVNVAARLQARAPIGGVLVDAPTRALAGEAATFAGVGSLSLKGRTRRLAAYRATQRPDAVPGGARTQHGGPFVGRDRELRELVQLFGGVMRERRSRLVSITGIAGIGKSRLAWEFEQHVDGLPDDIAWHAGHAPPYGDTIAFAPVAEMVRRRIRVADGAPAALARRQLATALEELVRDDAERTWMEPRLAVLLGHDDLAVYDREELFAAWRRFFERVSDQAPAVLVFEDLQWADPSLLDFIEHLASWTRDHPIFVLALARPELLDHRPTWGAALGSFTALHLERLPDAAIRALLAGHVPGLADALVRQILERAGGVPLYAVEVVRILADRGPLHEASVVVPESLHGLIAARIDALPAPERSLLMAAAVLGRRFPPDALVAVAATDPHATRDRVDSLMRRELLALNDETTSPGHGELMFVQDLVREVAYRTVGRAERRSLHLGAARYLESRDGGDLAESLAGHLVEVHAMAPAHPDAPRIARRAVAALRRAAADAIRLHIPGRALEHLERALELAAEPTQRAALLAEAAAAARAAAKLELAEQHLRELITLRTAAGERGDAARARAQLASVLLSAQQNEPALTELEAAMRAIADFGSDRAGVELAAQLARARTLVGEDRAGLEWADRALAAAARLRLDAVATDILVTRGTARFRLGDEQEGLADLRTAISQANGEGWLNTELRARNNLAWLVVADDPRATFDTARGGFELATEMGIGELAEHLADVACAAAIDTGDWDWALETVTALGHGSTSEASRIDLATSAAVIRVLRGDPDPMRPLDALEPLPENTDVQTIAGVQHSRAWAALVAGELDDARRLAREGAAASFGAERIHQWTLATRASLWMGDRDGAAACLGALDELNTPGRAIRAASMTLAAGRAALDGEPDAEERYRNAEVAWTDLDLPLPRALCLVDRHLLLGGEGDRDRALVAIGSLGARGLRRWANGGAAEVTASGGPRRRGRSHQPRADTAPPTDGARPRPRARGRRAPAG